MAAPRTTSKGRKRDPRSTMTVASRGSGRGTAKKAAKKPAKPSSRTAARSRSRSTSAKTTGAALPAWSDLSAKGNAVRPHRAAKPSLVDGVPTLRFVVLLAVACALFTLYVGHVYATQSLVAEAQGLQKEKLRLVLKRNRLRGEFDQMTAPAVILDRAAALGLEPGSAYGPTISLTE